MKQSLKEQPEDEWSISDEGHEEEEAIDSDDDWESVVNKKQKFHPAASIIYSIIS